MKSRLIFIGLEWHNYIYNKFSYALIDYMFKDTWMCSNMDLLYKMIYMHYELIAAIHTIF